MSDVIKCVGFKNTILRLYGRWQAITNELVYKLVAECF